MKAIIEYQCEICFKKYSEAEHAIECEASGAVDTTKYPVGLMHSTYHHQEYIGIFAIPPDGVRSWEPNRGHLLTIVYWACRKNPKYGDNLKEFCGNGSLYRSDEKSVKNYIRYHQITEADKQRPEFDRMVKHLVSQGITPIYYNELGELMTVLQTPATSAEVM